jgi:Regulator of ribonuclease activity B
MKASNCQTGNIAATTFLFVLSSRGSAAELANQLKRDGFETKVTRGDGQSLSFQVHARTMQRLSRRRIRAFVEEILEPFATRYGGTVAGWTREGRWEHDTVAIQRLR